MFRSTVFLLSIGITGCLSLPVPLTTEIPTARLESPLVSGGFIKGRVAVSVSNKKEVVVVKDILAGNPLDSGTGIDRRIYT